MRRVIHAASLPAHVPGRLASLGEALARCPGGTFPYLFGSAATGRLNRLSDVDVAVHLDEGANRLIGRLAAMLRAVAAHLGTDEVDVVVLNGAPTALVGRILGSRKVILDPGPRAPPRIRVPGPEPVRRLPPRRAPLLARRYRRG